MKIPSFIRRDDDSTVCLGVDLFDGSLVNDRPIVWRCHKSFMLVWLLEIDSVGTIEFLLFSHFHLLFIFYELDYCFFVLLTFYKPIL